MYFVVTSAGKRIRNNDGPIAAASGKRTTRYFRESVHCQPRSAKECRPPLKRWVWSGTQPSPEGAIECRDTNLHSTRSCYSTLTKNADNQGRAGWACCTELSPCLETQVLGGITCNLPRKPSCMTRDKASSNTPWRSALSSCLPWECFVCSRRMHSKSCFRLQNQSD